MPDVLSISYPTQFYPYATGYAQLDDVKANINAGTWDPSKPTAAPTAAMVQRWLCNATAMIDAALARRGYYVPLTVNPGWTPPPGMPLWNGVALQAWSMLNSIAAAYATHYVEASRHGSIGSANQDQNATNWMAYFDDFLTRIEAGTDNLVVFGAGGGWAPDPNPARAASSGSLGFTYAGGRREGPMFNKYENLGSGWENTTRVINSVNTPANEAFTSGPPDDAPPEDDW